MTKRMHDLVLYKIFIKISLLFFVLINSGCESNPKPTFAFSDANKNIGLVAFSVDCGNIVAPEVILEFYDEHRKSLLGRAGNGISLVCKKNFYNGIIIRDFLAGDYNLGAVGLYLEYSENYNFHFVVKPQKITYLGRIILMKEDRNKLRVGINDNESVLDDLPLIEKALPNVPNKDYIVLNWSKDFLGDFYASPN